MNICQGCKRSNEVICCTVSGIYCTYCCDGTYHDKDKPKTHTWGDMCKSCGTLWENHPHGGAYCDVDKRKPFVSAGPIAGSLPCQSCFYSYSQHSLSRCPEKSGKIGCFQLQPKESKVMEKGLVGCVCCGAACKDQGRSFLSTCHS